MTKLKFKTGVRYNGTRFSKGQVESGFTSEEVELFVKKDLAFVVGVPVIPNSSNPTEQTVSDNKKFVIQPENLNEEEIYRELHENWTADELKIDAERIGIVFDKKTTKKDLIRLIIKDGYADGFLSMLEDETEE